jgi:hypothetical protein
MKAIIISHNQSKYIKYFEEKLKDIEHLYVIDRPTEIYAKNINAIYNFNGSGFLAGYCRDLGASKYNYDDDLLFLDGDKFPIKGNLEELNNIPGDVVLLSVENDIRKIFNELVPNTTKEYIIKDKINPYNNVFSCGILLRKRFINHVRKINNDGRIFKEIFDGNFGEEDTFLGDVVSYNYDKEKFSIYITNKIILNGGFSCEKDRNEELIVNFAKRNRLKFSGIL